MRRKSVAEERPDLVAQWALRNPLSPDKVSCGSHQKVWWVCTKGHEWEAVVKNRALLGSGCPYCEHRAVLKGYNDMATVNPELARSWSPKNQKKPSEYAISSNAEVLWVCENGHEWKARVADRAEGHGCPYCAGHKVWKGFNDLATTHPKLIPEWSDRNKDISPESITYKNRTNVWWHCRKCGKDYKAVVYARANGRVCPYCIAYELQRLRDQRLARKKISKDFSCLLPQLATIYYAGKNGLKVKTDAETFIGIPVTAYIPEIRLIIDVSNSPKEKKLKQYICNMNNIKYISMREKLPEDEIMSNIRAAFSAVHIYLKSSASEDLAKIRERYTHWVTKAPDSSSEAS